MVLSPHFQASCCFVWKIHSAISQKIKDFKSLIEWPSSLETAARELPSPTSLPQPHSWSAAIRIDERDTGGFEGNADGQEVFGRRHVGAAFKVGDR